MNEEKRFEQELELFRKECESAAQFFFGYLAIHEVARRRKAVLNVLNRNAMFWNTATGAMQTAAIIAIGRVFDQSSPHNIDRVLKLAQDNPSIFSRASLGRRKQGGAGEAPSWLGDYLAKAYVPLQSDFRRLRAHVKRRRLRYSVNAAGRLSLPRTTAFGVHRNMVHEVEQVLVRAAVHEGSRPMGRRQSRRG